MPLLAHHIDHIGIVWQSNIEHRLWIIHMVTRFKGFEDMQKEMFGLVDPFILKVEAVCCYIDHAGQRASNFLAFLFLLLNGTLHYFYKKQFDQMELVLIIFVL